MPQTHGGAEPFSLRPPRAGRDPEQWRELERAGGRFLEKMPRDLPDQLFAYQVFMSGWWSCYHEHRAAILAAGSCRKRNTED